MESMVLFKDLGTYSNNDWWDIYIVSLFGWFCCLFVLFRDTGLSVALEAFTYSWYS